MRRLVLVGFLLLSAAGSASAQPTTEPQVTFTATNPEGLLAPETGEARSTLTFRMTCPLGGSIRSFQVSFHPKDVPSYAQVILNPPSMSIFLPPDLCAQPDYFQEITGEAIVTTSDKAPAYEELDIVIEATASNGEDEYGPYQTSFSVVHDYVPLMVVNPAQLFLKAPQGALVTFPVELENLANGKTRYELRVTASNASGLSNARLEPAEMVLDSKMQDGGQAFKDTILVKAETSRGEIYENKVETMVLNVTARSAERDASSTESHSVVLTVQIQGTAATVPAPALVFALAMVLSAALCLRRLAAVSGRR